MAIKRLEKRFGTIAVEKGFITVSQLMDAFEIQVREDVAKENSYDQRKEDAGLRRRS
jgi:hypothetical protein